jgi:putative membrane protein
VINYNTKEWFGIFRLHKADTFRKLLPLIIGLCIYSTLVVVIEKEWLHLKKGSHLENITLMHTLLGFAISMLLVFRTNTAYDRWWEGRKLWGSLVNNCRNLALKLSAFLPKEDGDCRHFFLSAIPRFPAALMQHLRSDATALELDDQPHPEIPDFDTDKHLPAQVAGLLIDKVNALYRAGTLTAEHMIVLNGELSSLMDIAGACERIRNTPIPYSYSAFIKKFIFVYVITMPFGFMFTLGYLSVPIVAFIFYVLASLELIAEEIEEPFGLDPNDLPMGRLCDTIAKNVREILD